MKKLEIYKNGNFLNAYEENAIILHKLFNYKVIESDNHKYKCGFPLTQYNKIINGLQDNKISYIVYDKENILEDKDYLKYCKKVIEEKLNKEYKLELNKNKSMITRSSNGINFLGHRFIIKSNKTIIKITNSTKRKIKTGIRKNLNKYNNKLINYQKILVVSQIISIVIFLLIIKRLTRLAGEIVMKRYEITKKFYKHYIIYILVKDKYRLYNVDKEISNNFKLDRVNVIKLNNLDIESIIEYEDNRYVNLYAKTKIIKIINRYRL